MSKRFRWDEEQLAFLRRRYMDENASPMEIAEEMGLGAARAKVVRRKVSLLGWSQQRPPEVSRAARMAGLKVGKHMPGGPAWRSVALQELWSAEAVAMLRRMYAAGAGPDEVAEALGPPATYWGVVKKAKALGIKRDLTDLLRRSQRLATAARWANRPAGAEPLVTVAPPVVIDLEAERAAIDAAIAAGKVTVLPAGYAAGTTVWERLLHTAPAPRPEGPDEAERRARARRAGRQSALSVASGYRKPREARA